MAMDIIYKKAADFSEETIFSIDLISNNQIEEMLFKGKDEWLMPGLDLKIKPIKVEYQR